MVVSHSRLSVYRQCPYRYMLRYIDEVKPFPDTADPANARLIGTALHTGIEKDVKTAIQEYYMSYPIITDRHVAEAMKLECRINQCKALLPDGEHEVEISLPDFQGYIDLLVPVSENIYDLYDFKYSNGRERYLEGDQLHIYKAKYEEANPGKIIRNLYFLFSPKSFIRQKKTETLREFRARLAETLKESTPELVKVDYDQSKVDSFNTEAIHLDTTSDFPKHPGRLCDWCEYKKFCESDEREDYDIMQLPSKERRDTSAPKRKKLWLYGVPFCGKTYLANQFPVPLMLNTDGNINYVDAPYIPIKDEVVVEGRITKRKYAWDTFKEAVAELEKGSEFETVVVDLLEDLYDACRVKVCAERGWEHESDDSFKAYDIIRSEFLRTLRRLFALDLNIVLISHEDTSRDITKKSNDKITAIKPNIADKIANKVAGMVDIVARVVNDGGHRSINFKTNEVTFGGGRLAISENEIPCSYEALDKVYGSSTKAADTKRMTRVVDKPNDVAQNTDTPPWATAAPSAEAAPAYPQEVEPPTTFPSEAPAQDTQPDIPRRRRRTTEEAATEQPRAEAEPEASQTSATEQPSEQPEIPRRRRRTIE